MTNERRAEMLRRGGIDPIRLDKRPLAVIMGDCIPEAKWERQLQIIQRAGFKDQQDCLRFVHGR